MPASAQKPAELFIWFPFRSAKLLPQRLASTHLSIAVQTTTAAIGTKSVFTKGFVLVSAHSRVNRDRLPFLKARFEEIFDERNEFNAATVEDYPPPAA